MPSCTGRWAEGGLVTNTQEPSEPSVASRNDSQAAVERATHSSAEEQSRVKRHLYKGSNSQICLVVPIQGVADLFA
jgi:hypothetical protein